MAAYYNEIDPFAAAWLRELIHAGHIAPGDVDERSIEDVIPDDLMGFTQCHFFAGIGVWSYALRRAGWPDDRPVWTGSCPCQPFSSSGKQQGFEDKRHLWPEFYRLISQCRPPVCFGEQVASKPGLAWLDLVQTNLEKSGYAVGAVDTCAAGVGAPHLRQRLYWVGHTEHQGRDNWGLFEFRGNDNSDRGITSQGGDGNVGWICTDSGQNCNSPVRLELTGSDSWMAHTHINRSQGWLHRGQDAKRKAVNGQAGCNSATCGPGPTNGFWRDADWLLCRDGKWRAVRPGTFPLAHGAAARVGRLRGYGNAINAEQAKAFIKAFMEIKEHQPCQKA